MACGILVPQPGIEPGPSAVKAPSPNHWSAREFPVIYFMCSSVYMSFPISQFVPPPSLIILEIRRSRGKDWISAGYFHFDYQISEKQVGALVTSIVNQQGLVCLFSIMNAHFYISNVF